MTDMTDNKPNELIDRYGDLRALRYNGIATREIHLQAKQAILDYVEAEKNRAVDEGIAFALHNREET